MKCFNVGLYGKSLYFSGKDRKINIVKITSHCSFNSIENSILLSR